MFPDVELKGASSEEDGALLGSLSCVSVAVDDLRFWGHSDIHWMDSCCGHAQTFGSDTATLLKILSVAFIGCLRKRRYRNRTTSGLDMGRLILADPDVFEGESQSDT